MRGWYTRIVVVTGVFAGYCTMGWAQELPSHHSADTNFDNRIGLSELIRVIQYLKDRNLQQKTTKFGPSSATC